MDAMRDLSTRRRLSDFSSSLCDVKLTGSGGKIREARGTQEERQMRGRKSSSGKQMNQSAERMGLCC